MDEEKTEKKFMDKVKLFDYMSNMLLIVFGVCAVLFIFGLLDLFVTLFVCVIAGFGAIEFRQRYQMEMMDRKLSHLENMIR